MGNGISVGWSNNEPANTDNAGLGDDVIRSKSSNLQGLIDAEHNFPSGGGANCGYHRYGSARPYVGTPSQVSSDGTDGRLMVDTSGVAWSLSSTAPSLMGHPGILFSAVASTYSTPPKFGTKVLYGQGAAFVSAATRIAFESAYSGKPFVFLQPINDDRFMSLPASDTTGFTTKAFNDAGSIVESSFNWVSIGTCSMGVP